MTCARPFFIATALLLMSVGLQSQAKAAGRSYQECQALAVQRGVSIRYTHRVFQDYERFKAAGTAIHPRGLIARCMAGKG